MRKFADESGRERRGRPSLYISLCICESLFNMRKKFVCFLWICFVLVVCAAAAFFAAIARGWIGYVPPLAELQTPISRFASQVVSADGVLLGTWSRSENRIFVDYDEISPHVFRALVATEDVRFNRHSGIDIRALGRAVVNAALRRQGSRRRQYHHPAAGQTALLVDSVQLCRASPAKAHRMGHCRRTRTAIHEGRDSDTLLELLRLPARRRGH